MSLRVLVTALVVSEPSSSTIQLIFSPPSVAGRISIVFFSGMPSDAAGPVADSVTPMLMSASAAFEAASAAASAVTTQADVRFMALLVGVAALDGRGRHANPVDYR